MEETAVVRVRQASNVSLEGMIETYSTMLAAVRERQSDFWVSCAYRQAWGGLVNGR